MLVAVAALGVVLGVLFGASYSKERYQDPHLHSGRWGLAVVAGRGEQTRVVWECEGGFPICTGTNHGPKRCTIGPGMAHVDECMCGKKRYGVFGAWS